MAHLLLPITSGLAEGMILVLVASGLALTFGVMRIVNMAHGGFLMLGAFLFYSFTRALGTSIAAFVASLVLSGISVGIVGALAESTIYRRLYGRDPLAGLLGTFALLLLFEGAVPVIWGNQPLATNIAKPLQDTELHISDVGLPLYDFIPIGVGAALLVILGLGLYRTELGLRTRSVGRDRDMAGLLGLNVRRIFLGTFVLGCVMAGLAGALLAPTISLDSTLGSTYIVLAFAVLLVGGLGSLRGTVIAGLLLGLLDSVIAFYSPQVGGYTIYIAMIVVLLFRPSGLFAIGGHDDVHL